MKNPQNEWQKEEFELSQFQPLLSNNPLLTIPQPRSVDRPYLTIIGPYIELENVMKFLKKPFIFHQFELPAFTELPSLGKTCLVLNLNTHIMFTTEIGLLVGEWRRFYFPEQYVDLVQELVTEAKRIKQ